MAWATAKILGARQFIKIRFVNIHPKNQLIEKDPDVGKDWRQTEKGSAEFR